MDFDFSQYFNAENLDKIIRIAFILVFGLGFFYALAFLVRRTVTWKMSKQSRMIVNRIIIYTGFVIITFTILNELNFDITALFGAAGVLGIVIGIASQTSIGNIISGFFLISEKSFELGDVVRLGTQTGTVYSIDLLSIKIKTYDNLLIRIPNQTVISSELVNVTRFPIRRLDLTVSVAYKENLSKVVEVLKEVARNNPLCLEEPEPVILFQQFGSSSIDILFATWFEKTNFVAVKNSLFIEIKEAFDREGIEIPFPHVSLYAGEATKSFPVDMISTKK
ncbi:mechanosensitive ion channel family protein [Sunxiuqinia sp. A32]|uniref:mechanosensitive ion channel family protein n=1 Tax=Sunxiuqinia sp. A32 TaxID=3461496 RepID=UPI00404621C7